MASVKGLLSMLHKCRKEKDLARAKRVHAHICIKGMETHRVLGNHIVPMFVDCGSLLCAQQIFNRLIHRNEHSWTSLISGYIQFGQPHHALTLYQKMQENKVCLSKYTLMAILKACSRLKDLERGKQTHSEIAQLGFDTDLSVANTLIDMYAKCGSLSEAQVIFNRLQARDVVSWNALISGYVEQGYGDEALKCLKQMQLEDVFPDTVTYVCSLKACASIGALEKGQKLHIELKKKSFESDLFVSNTLVDMYAKCGSMSEAWEVFNKLQIRDVVSWNALITGYAENGACEEVLKCIEQMQLEGVSPDAVTFVCGLKACSRMGAINKGRQLHVEIRHEGFERDLLVGCTLVDTYAKCGILAEAQDVFDKLPSPDVVTWTTLIAGYLEHGFGQKALNCYEQMQLKDISPDAFAFVCGLKACGSIGAIEKGRKLHNDAAHKHFERDPFVGSALIDMYSRCGSLQEACGVFNKLQTQHVVLWSAMINGYGMNHASQKAVQCFENMQEQDVKPDAITFSCLLTACSRANMVAKGQEYFKVMKEEHGIIPTTDHCSCMIDLIARSGHLREAEELLETVPCSASTEMWVTLLSACKTYADIELGLRCFQQVVQVNPEYAVPYVLMANTHASSARMDDAYRIEELRRNANAKKRPAIALIEVNNTVHEFLVGGSQTEEVSAMLESMDSGMKKGGDVPNLDTVLRPVSDAQKESTLCEHAEKLALAFGLLSTPKGQTLRVTKNMRMCNNCHNANKTLSRIENREIIVRDGYSIHHFTDGLCSCKDIF